MIRREITDELQILITEYPVVTILGPRQAGKTTLARKVLKGYGYSNLEIPDVRQLAKEDPRAYFEQLTAKTIIDEIQRVPELLSYIQAIVDEDNRPGQFVLTGSHQFQLRQAVSQSLAGRTAILHLLPLSISELKGHSIEFDSFEDYCFTGFLPRIHDKHLRPGIAYSNYYQTYIERDIRLLINLKDLSLFEKFLKLMAGRVGQLLNVTSLSNDVGVDTKTIQNWISILEASFILFKLVPYYKNFGKRVIKSPKYYFTDVGLLCFLLGIRRKDQITRDPLVGNIFENLVVIESLKSKYNRGEVSDLFFYRDSNGNEVDMVYQDGRDLIAIEIKSAKTFTHSHLKGLNRFRKISPKVNRGFLVYRGGRLELSNKITAINFKETDTIFSN